jgi:HK97 family phage major capsid protein
MVEAHNALCVKIADADTPNPDDIHACKMSEEKVKGHELLIENARRQQALAADNAVGRLGGQLRAKVAENFDGKGPSMFTASSGREVRMAVGRDQKLSTGVGLVRNGVGELVRAAAVGVKAWTPKEVRQALRSDQNSSGGYSVPDEWLANWIDRAVEVSVLGPFAQRTLMTTETARITTVEERPEITTKAQLDTFTNSSIVFGSRQLSAFTCGATMLASLELLEDSPNASAQIEAVSLRALGDWFDRVMLAGTGSAEPLGLLERTDIPSDNSAGAVSWDMLAEAVSEVREELYQANGIVVSPAVYNALHVQRELTAGDGGYLAKPMHLDGLPILQTTHCDDARILVGDLSQLMIGVRSDARIEVSAHAGESFERNAVTFRVKMRADFLPLDLKAFYILRGVTLS